jgi:myo-inositol-1(or 4)-monophosphatase
LGSAGRRSPDGEVVALLLTSRSSSEGRESVTLAEIGNLALQAAHQVHEDLGAEGERSVRANKFGDTALKVDIEAERAVLELLAQNGVSIKVISEEHGTTVIGNNPEYLGILDGLDGSDLYREKRGVGRYGTMLAIYSGTDPRYGEYLYAGIMEHVRTSLYFAAREQGSWVLEEDSKKPIYCSQATSLDSRSTQLYADLYYDGLHHSDVLTSLVKRLNGYTVSTMQSSAVHYADLAQGTVDGVVECTRKDNLEIAAAFPLITEAGGVMTSIQGVDLIDQRYSEFGQSVPIPIISASTKSLATAIAAKLLED